jgi:hypothetical protein
MALDRQEKTMAQRPFYPIVCRTLALAALTAVLMTPAFAQGSRQYPSSDRNWSSADYKDLDATVGAGTMLPTLDDASGRAVFERMVNIHNFDIVRNKSLPVASRLSEAIAMGNYAQKFLLAYLAEAQKGKPYDRELAKFQVFTLDYASALLAVADDFVPTIAHDERYETRMAGLAKMREGMRTIMTGVVESISETQFYSTASTIEMAQGVVAYLPSFRPVLSDQDRQDYARRIGRQMETTTDADVKAALGRLQTALQSPK